MNELHRMVLVLLKFGAEFRPAQMDVNTPTEEFRPDRWVLTHNGKFMGSSWMRTEDGAWAQTPSLESLTKPLIKALGLKNTVMIDVTPQGQFVVTLGYSQSNTEAGTPLTAAHVGIFAASTSLDEAVASVFVAAVRQLLVDVESVVI